MLVFATGLVISLMLTGTFPAIKVSTDQLKQIKDYKIIEDRIKKGEGTLQKIGEAYKDPVTGKIYIIDKNQ
ncbi:hypothetical protein [Caldanaerobacter subterraneus]|uniref:Uncharacterized protein n=1 Tax=Caldanaerobacter subterraneus TaxID=911092 RepID=A0A7Y2PMA9_9THEO|nr:hypothetical protein [Caldanaerobacter subterraneus]NNG66461.1 hypothetical protein [Caldanaerobacter subterraneus]